MVSAWAELECLKGKTLRGISTFDVERGKIERARGVTKRGAKRSQRTVNAELIIISSLFHRAIDDQLAESNPCTGVEHFDVPMGPPRVLSFAEEERLMPQAANSLPYLLPFVTLALGTGMREMEMLRMRKPQLDFARNLIFVTNPK